MREKAQNPESTRVALPPQILYNDEYLGVSQMFLMAGNTILFRTILHSKIHLKRIHSKNF